MKRSPSPEGTILPEVTWGDMQPRLIERLRAHAVRLNADHAWKNMTDAELVADAELSRPDPITGETGYTLAALLLLGSNEALRANLPFQGTQIVYRPGKWQRGEKEDLRTNLLETHDQLMTFAVRHLPEHLETTPKGETLNLRDLLLSEIFANSLSYRDYGKVYPARFVIEADRVFMENGMASGKKPGQKFSPNPLITNVFRQIGWGPKPASKSSLITQWGKAYFGILPMVVEGSVYRILAPFPKKGAQAPTISHSWDISEMLTTQAPWTHSKAAQNEVDLTRTALNDLVEDPMLSEVENMRIPARLDSRDEPKAAESPEPPVTLAPKVTVAPAAPVQPIKPIQSAAPTGVQANGHTNGYANGHAAAAPRQPDPAPSVHGLKNQAVIQAERTEKILEFCKSPRYRSEVQAHVGIVNRDYFRKDILNPLIEKGLLFPTLPDKPNSPKQQYSTLASQDEGARH